LLIPSAAEVNLRFLGFHITWGEQRMRNGRHLTRRTFLQRSLAAASGAWAAPYLLTSGALAAAGRPGANDRIGLGFIGIGNMGGGHLGGLVGSGDFQILAISDVKAAVAQAGKAMVEQRYASDPARGSFRGEKYTGVALYNDFRELLARDDIDAVVIASPDHWHATMAVLAMRAGKDVYCEKPLCLTIREGRQMVDAARRYSRVFQTGSQQRSEGNFRFACELVRNGYIGEVKEVHVGVGGPSSDKQFPPEPVPEGVDWDRWLGPSPWHPYNSERISGNYGGGWRQVRDTSGGMMTDWGAHHFDIAQWGLGRDESGPVEVIPPNRAERQTLTYRYDNGITMYHGGANGILFTGTAGKVEVNRGYLKTWPDSLKSVQLKPADVHLYNSPGHHQDWINCIRNRRRPICDVAIGFSTITVCHLGNIAWWLGQSFHWDPKAEQITDNPEAARWLDRPKREPWAWI
jgi:predicted dehydrogenase